MPYITKEKFIKLYSEKILENKASIFLGAGINKEVGLPDWEELLEDVFVSLELESNKKLDLPLVTQFYINEKGSEKELLNLLKNRLNLKKREPGENLSNLVKLPISNYWTTNYDNLLEKALDGENKSYKLVYNKTQFFNLSNNNISIFKIHGDLIDQQNLVISQQHYDLYEKDRKFFWDKLVMELISKNFLFVGLSMEDRNLNLVLNKINLLLDNEKDRSEHFIIIKKEKETGSLEQKLLSYKIKDLNKRFNIKTILVDCYSELSEIFNSINKIILRKNIFISGAAYEYDEYDDNEKNSKMFLYNLASLLCEKNKKIITGFGLGVGDSIIQGAIDYIKEKDKNLEENLDIWPFPQYSQKHDIKSVWTKYRNKIIDKSGVVIFVFGNKFNKENGKIEISNGMMEEFEIAKSKNKTIIPIGSTGYISKKILEKIEEDIENFSYLKGYIGILKTEKNCEKIVEVILKILDKVD